MLEHTIEVVTDFLVKLFNKAFDGGTFPREWSRSSIVPVHKKGDVNQPDNYRGTALTSAISKVYAHILNKRLSEWAEVEEKILEEQLAGFILEAVTLWTTYFLCMRWYRNIYSNTQSYLQPERYHFRV